MNTMFRKSMLVMALAATGMSTTVSAADGDKLLDVNFDNAVVGQTLAAAAGATTDFSMTTFFGQANNGPAGSMWDPGTYVIGSNPNDFHAFWVNLPDADPQLIVNGFQSTDQKVLSVTVKPEVCANPNSRITFDFQANATNILPLSAASDGGAVVSVVINNTMIGSAEILSNDPNGAPLQIVGSVPWAPELTVSLLNNGTAYSGNDFAIDDITLTQRGACQEVCVPTVNGVWHNYTGKFDPFNAKKPNGKDTNHDGIPDLDDPNWKPLPATPGGEHDLADRGFDKPYQPGKDKGKGDWFVWKDLGTTCPN